MNRPQECPVIVCSIVGKVFLFFQIEFISFISIFNVAFLRSPPYSHTYFLRATYTKDILGEAEAR